MMNLLYAAHRLAWIRQEMHQLNTRFTESGYRDHEAERQRIKLSEEWSQLNRHTKLQANIA